MTKITIKYLEGETRIILKDNKIITINQNRFPKIEEITIDNTKHNL